MREEHRAAMQAGAEGAGGRVGEGEGRFARSLGGFLEGAVERQEGLMKKAEECR